MLTGRCFTDSCNKGLGCGMV